MTKPDTDMIPPHSIELEETILSTCFIAGGEVLSEIVGLVSRDYFYTLAHKEIYSAIQDVAMHADSADLVTVMTILKDNGLLEKVGGATYLSHLIDLPIAVDVEYSCKKLEEKFLLRKTIEKCYATIKKCHKESDFEQVMNYYVESAHSVSDGSKAGDPVVSMKEISMEASDVYAIRYKSKKVVTGVASGLHDLDALTFGFHPGDLTILAARPPSQIPDQPLRLLSKVLSSLGDTLPKQSCCRSHLVCHKLKDGLQMPPDTNHISVSIGSGYVQLPIKPIESKAHQHS